VAALEVALCAAIVLHATVVFSDLSGYTALNERLDPEDVERIVARIRSEAIAVVESHGGIVNQFVGDEVMALFGVPHAGRDDAVRAARAALALHEAVRVITAKSGDTLALTLHSGINSGLVIVRPSAQHDGRCALTGDTVNTAARLLKLAGANTWRAVLRSLLADLLSPFATQEITAADLVEQFLVCIEGSIVLARIYDDPALRRCVDHFRRCLDNLRGRAP